MIALLVELITCLCCFRNDGRIVLLGINIDIADTVEIQHECHISKDSRNRK